MRWFVGTTSVFMWIVLLVGSVSAQRTNNIDPSLRDSTDEINKRPVGTQGTTTKRANPVPNQSRADGTLPSREQVNNGTVTIITAPEGGAFPIMGSDLAAVLDDGERLRVLPVLGKNQEQNVIDILRLRTIDMGFVASDTLDLVKAKYGIQNIDNRLKYITKIFNADLHIVARKEIKTIYDLEGKKIFCPIGYPTLLNILNRLQIKANIDTTPDDIGVLQKMLNGEGDAWIVLAGKIAPIIRNIKNDEGRFHLVAVPWDKAVQDVYLPSSITNADYPNLAANGETVDTLALSIVLMVYNWPPGTERYNRIANFIDAMFSKIDLLRQPIRHPKWRETSIFATVPGVQRFKAAEDWLEAHQTDNEARTTVTRDPQLYNEFLQWRRSQNR
jgi:uncharacterized protein